MNKANCNHDLTEFRKQRYQIGKSEWQKINQCLDCGMRLPFNGKTAFWPTHPNEDVSALPPYDFTFDLNNECLEIVSVSHEMKTPCKVCEGRIAVVYYKNGQNLARCVQCGAGCYNPSKIEMGQAPDVPTRIGKIKQSQRMRVLARDGAKCLLCGKSGKDDVLHIAHIISDHDAKKVIDYCPDFKMDYIYDDENLFTCCSECNLGQGRESLIPRLAAFIAFAIRKNTQI